MQDSSHSSPGPEILVGVITFHRPLMLSALLDSLARQTLTAGNDKIALVVVDNDPGRSAEAAFQEKSKPIPFPATYLSEPKRGIPFARNRILDEALSRNARYIAFIDDDEMATEDWLEQLYAVIRETGADAVQGPVRYVPEAGCAAWMAEELAWRSRRMQKHKEASVRPKLSTRNVIMSVRLVSELGLRFDESFALSGGSDVDFFYRAHQKGSKNIWTNRALVIETVPLSRLTLGFQLQRAFRSAAGTTHSRCAINGWVATALLTFPKIMGKLVMGLLQLLTTGLFSRRQRLRALRSLALGVGHISGLAGLRGSQYGQIQGY